MASNSSIEWTDATWTVTTGCTEKSSGCANCYARGMSFRLAGMARADERKGKDPGKKAAYKLAIREDGRWSGVVTPVEAALTEPLGWKSPRRIFVNSMSDLFWGDDDDLAEARRRGVKDPQPVPFEFIDRVFAVMALCPQHTFQVLTKRTARLAKWIGFMADSPRAKPTHERVYYARGEFRTDAPVQMPWPLLNVWIGTSVEKQSEADERIPQLLRCPAAVRFLSMEPLLGPVNLEGAVGCTAPDRVVRTSNMIDWVIVGGESGHGARPMHPAWARSIRDQCAAAGVPFFFKQWGDWVGGLDFYAGADAAGPEGVYAELQNDTTARRDAIEDERWHNWNAEADDVDVNDPVSVRVGKKAAGRLLDGREHNDMPTAGQAVTP